jgi:hypothetical protein
MEQTSMAYTLWLIMAVVVEGSDVGLILGTVTRSDSWGE